ncbi:MAG: glycosyltransferase family 9 protein [Candidatus Omnitrophica bacterium]|nr:glycosyltransferase family 9 protein [Candidatus Omnitrophota bacterium]
MRTCIKKISPAWIKNIFRRLRRIGFYFLDLAGGAVFFLLRLTHLLPAPAAFVKEGIRKILIIRIDRIGDLVLSTPAIRAVRETFPESEISLLVSKYTKDLVINNENVNKVLTVEENKIPNEFDLAIALHPGLRQNQLTFLSGAKYRLGYSGWGGAFFLTQKLVDDRNVRIRHEIRSALEVVELAGCKTTNTDIEVSVTREGEELAQDFLSEYSLGANDRLVVVHPGARQDYMRWRKDAFAQVSDQLIEQMNVKVILIGSNNERQLVESINSLMKQKAINALGLELTGLVSLIKRAALFIGNSTGPMHIASALKVPVVAIFGSSHPLDSYKTWGPQGENSVIITKNIGCPSCLPADCRRFECMDLITAEEVFSAAKGLLERF